MIKLVIFIVASVIILYMVKSTFGTKVYIFYRDSCPACAGMMPEWDKFQDKVGLFSMIIPIKINTESGANEALMNSFGVESVPHIVKVGGDIRTVYTGERTAEDILKWAQS